MLLCLTAGLLVNIHNYLVYHIPLPNLASVLIGCIIAGFFIGLDSSLAQERKVILGTGEKETFDPPQRLFPITRKFTLVAITASIFVALVLILVFTRDVVWLTQTAQDEDAIRAAQLSVTSEIFFIMAVLMVVIVNLIFSYSRNLRLLFNNETRVLEQVSQGNLAIKVPVSTQDEFGVIAGHTNLMIDGLRHRFDLVNSLKLAEEVQQNLLPVGSPSQESFDISGISIYCDETGGDYYDYIVLPGEKIGVVIADSCGHGIGAAMLMVSVRAFLTSAVKNYHSPAQILFDINRYITRDCAKSGRFTTMFFLEIDSVTKKLQWVRAGHEPALMFEAQAKTFTHLDGPGLVLGVDDNYIFKDTKGAACREGDIIVIGTDGINETRNKDGKIFGQQQLQKIIKEHAEDSAQALQKAIVNGVIAFRGTMPQEDDITLVVIKVH